MKRTFIGALAGAAVGLAPLFATASSHMDAPSITLDDAANTTDVYAFITEGPDGRRFLTTALAVYPFQEPGIGPNAFQFDDEVRYAIHVALDDDVAAGRATISYEFDFRTEFANENTILQSYLGVLQPAGPGVFPDNQNRRQTYTVRQIDRRARRARVLGSGLADGLIVPPNNQGLVTPFYNQGGDGEAPALEGVADAAALDPYTSDAIATIDDGHVVFAGQRDDGFYADIQSIFDLDFTFGGPNKPFDSQAGFNLFTIVLSIPLDELTAAPSRGRRSAAEPARLAGVFATTSRPRFPRLQRARDKRSFRASSFLFDQVGRQGNPLFAEALLPIVDKDVYNESLPSSDGDFADSVANPELAAAIEALLGITLEPLVDLATIYQPDVIRVDLTTGPARLSGAEGFDRLSVLGGDTLESAAAGGPVPGGWPNGRRFGDDVVDIALIALGVAGPLGGDPADVDIDGVTANDISFNQVFPYAATPLNGRAQGPNVDQ
ncbi:MAG: DUF4331 domain-containing protein [Parvularculaceae bacterium]